MNMKVFCCILFFFYFGNGICNAQELKEIFNTISKMEDFQTGVFSPLDYGFPEEMGKMQMTGYGNSDPREMVLDVLSVIPNNLKKIDYKDDRDKILRVYLEKDNKGNAFYMQVYLGRGPADIAIMLFNGASYDYYQTIVQRIENEFNEE